MSEVLVVRAIGSVRPVSCRYSGPCAAGNAGGDGHGDGISAVLRTMPRWKKQEQE